MEKIVIHRNKLKILISSLALLFAAAIFFFFIYITIQSEDFESPFLKIIIIIFVVFCGLICLLSSFWFTAKLFDKKPIFSIDETGIYDNSSLVSLGFIPWTDINGIYELIFNRQKNIVISLKTPEDYLKKVNGLKKSLIKMNAKLNKNAYAVITSNLFDSYFSHEILLSLLQEFYTTYREE